MGQGGGGQERGGCRMDLDLVNHLTCSQICRCVLAGILGIRTQGEGCVPSTSQ